MKNIILTVLSLLFLSQTCQAFYLQNPIDNIKTRIEIKKLSKEINKNTENADLYFKRGKKYWSINKINNANIDFYTAYEIKPDFYEAYFYRANVYYFNKEYGWAFEVLTDLIKKNPNYKKAYELRANIYNEIHDFENQIKDINKILELDKNNFYYYSIRGLCYQELGNYEQAIKDYKKFLENSNNYHNKNYILFIKEQSDKCNTTKK